MSLHGNGVWHLEVLPRKNSHLEVVRQGAWADICCALT
jgi:hypothetical protein